MRLGPRVTEEIVGPGGLSGATSTALRRLIAVADRDAPPAPAAPPVAPPPAEPEPPEGPEPPGGEAPAGVPTPVAAEEHPPAPDPVPPRKPDDDHVLMMPHVRGLLDAYHRDEPDVLPVLADALEEAGDQRHTRVRAMGRAHDLTRRMPVPALGHGAEDVWRVPLWLPQGWHLPWATMCVRGCPFGDGDERVWKHLPDERNRRAVRQAELWWCGLVDQHTVHLSVAESEEAADEEYDLARRRGADRAYIPVRLANAANSAARLAIPPTNAVNLDRTFASAAPPWDIAVAGEILYGHPHAQNRWCAALAHALAGHEGYP